MNHHSFQYLLLHFTSAAEAKLGQIRIFGTMTRRRSLQKIQSDDAARENRSIKKQVSS
jgi:hypothetical protein